MPSNQTCLRELRERVANGGDPTKLREPPVVHDIPADEQGICYLPTFHFAIKVSRCISCIGINSLFSWICDYNLREQHPAVELIYCALFLVRNNYQLNKLTCSKSH